MRTVVCACAASVVRACVHAACVHACFCVPACVHACVSACMRACVCACVRGVNACGACVGVGLGIRGGPDRPPSEGRRLWLHAWGNLSQSLCSCSPHTVVKKLTVFS